MLIRGFPLYHKICLSEREFDKNMKLPNGYGSVVKMSGKRRKPYMVRKTIGWHLDKDCLLYTSHPPQKQIAAAAA